MGTASRPFCAVIFHIPELELGTKEFAKGMTTDLLKETFMYLDMFLYSTYVPVRRDPLPKAWKSSLSLLLGEYPNMYQHLWENEHPSAQRKSASTTALIAKCQHLCGWRVCEFPWSEIHGQAGAPSQLQVIHQLSGTCCTFSHNKSSQSRKSSSVHFQLKSPASSNGITPTNIKKYNKWYWYTKSCTILHQGWLEPCKVL